MSYHSNISYLAMCFLAACVYIALYSVKYEYSGMITHVAIMIHAWLGLSMYTVQIKFPIIFASSFQIIFLSFTIIYTLIYM